MQSTTRVVTSRPVDLNKTGQFFIKLNARPLNGHEEHVLHLVAEEMVAKVRYVAQVGGSPDDMKTLVEIMRLVRRLGSEPVTVEARYDSTPEITTTYEVL